MRPWILAPGLRRLFPVQLPVLAVHVKGSRARCSRGGEVASWVKVGAEGRVVVGGAVGISAVGLGAAARGFGAAGDVGVSLAVTTGGLVASAAEEGWLVGAVAWAAVEG